jgi:ElaB/YqjD/DUF883 family membrane-anchored ribosome-binding protein
MAEDADKRIGDDELTRQIAELKRELANLKAAIAERAGDVVEGVEGLYDSAAAQAERASQALRAQAGVVRDNPGTISFAFVLGGVIGLLLGMAISAAEPPTRRWYGRR